MSCGIWIPAFFRYTQDPLTLLVFWSLKKPSLASSRVPSTDNFAGVARGLDEGTKTHCPIDSSEIRFPFQRWAHKTIAEDIDAIEKENNTALYLLLAIDFITNFYRALNNQANGMMKSHWSNCCNCCNLSARENLALFSNASCWCGRWVV